MVNFPQYLKSVSKYFPFCIHICIFLCLELFIHMCAVSLVARLGLTLCNRIDCSPPCSSVHWDSPGKNPGVGCHALLQGIFPAQGSNPGLLHCKWILYHLRNQRSPFIHISSVQSFSRVWPFVIAWTAAHQAPLSITNFQSSLKLMSIVSVMPSNHLILCRPLLLMPSIFPSIRVFSNESVLHIRWPKHWSFSFSISPSNEYSGLISFRMDWLDLLEVQGTLKFVFSKTTVQKHQFFSAQLSL